ncbi:hypothetical protein ACFQBQ_07390 [Granulicella cerasi]|uniref:Uncharacterized protein n=1 Tax=Granulicella cerasi TaxID=741063 RepID=A0ABW1ZAG0_9BACT|nr:hypothetical protein [Granulicella cerasi]
MNAVRCSAIALLSLTMIAAVGCKKKDAQTPINVTPAGSVVPQPFLGTWPASSNTATAILGDITIGSTTMRLGDHVVVIDSVNSLAPTDTAALAGFNTVQGTPVQAFLAKVPIAGSTPMLNGNVLCGGRDTQWLVGVLGSNAQLGLIAFSGANAPVLTSAALQNSHDVCGSFSFAK